MVIWEQTVLQPPGTTIIQLIYVSHLINYFIIFHTVHTYKILCDKNNIQEENIENDIEKDSWKMISRVKTFYLRMVE